jgi:predicted cupin superfamily sugar epimerase
MSAITAREVIERLGMQRHPEGGWFVQTFEDPAQTDGRAHSTAIYYLLEAGEVSHWHRVDAVEVWHYYAGAAIELSLSDGENLTVHRLGINLASGERPQIIVPKGGWQSAASTGAWTLVGCTVAPGFRFSGFELAAPGWTPGAH